MKTPMRVAILYGGKSVEHEISINSARNIAEYIDNDAFDPIHIGISKQGNWFLTEGVVTSIESGDPVTIDLGAKPKTFTTRNGATFTLDIVFPVLHGTDGEDGSIQGMLCALEIPFVGSGVLGSSLSMNKLYAKKLMQTVGIPVGEFLSFSSDEKQKINYTHIIEKVGLPFMAKAANLGSSVGVYKIASEETFSDAIADIFTYDNILICEEFIEGRELECAILGNEDAQASLPGEVVVSKEYEFYTYEAKYLDPDAAKIVVPADVPAEITEKIRDLSVRAFNVLNCQDFARVDLFLKEDGSIMINEINTIPGFTNSSMFPMMWKERGISFTELIARLIHLAIARNKKESDLVTTRKR